MKVVGFDHVVVNTSNPEALLAFYCNELGLEPVRVDEWRKGDVLFPSVRVTPETVIDLLPAERTGENMSRLMHHRKAARVFPVPVGARIKVDSPRAIAGQPCT